jgi:hypothetical protein
VVNVAIEEVVASDGQFVNLNELKGRKIWDGLYRLAGDLDYECV